MGKNKKKFIDKKNASSYHLMHRSQRDVGGDILEEGTEIGNTGMILWPDPNNNPDTDRKVLLAAEEEDKMREWRSKLAQVGLLEEKHDEQYLKPITGTGTFLSATGKVDNTNALQDPRTQAVTEELLAEVNQQYEGIPLSADVMDDDIEQALMGDFDEGDFEEIADDFVFDAAQEPEAGDKDAFDFDAHIAKLMEDAKREREDGPSVPVDQHDWGAQDHDFFSNVKPLHTVGEEDSLFGGTNLDVTPGVVPSLKPDEERALCEQFERALAEYDSDEMGYVEDEDIQGDRPLEGDAQMEAALDDYLQERDGGFFMQGKSHDWAAEKGGSGFSALVGTRMIPVKELDAKEILGTEEPERPLTDVLKDAKRTIQSPKLEPPPEEIFIDGKSYFSMKERNPWDVESILSTYSNLDNNPVTIGAPSRRKKGKKHQKIQLSSKTGLPIVENPIEEEDDYDDDDDDYNDQTIISVNRGVARKKKETAEEKRARKAQVKKERQMARIQKKVTKEVYKEEFLNRTGPSDDVTGKAVFRYS